MDQPKVTTPTAPAPSLNPQGIPPAGLPVLENKKIVTHTMKEDIARIGGVSGAPIGTEEKTVKPFSENIPPPPLPPMPSGKDVFQESMEDIPIERDQPISFPGAEEAGQTPKQFKIFIPPPKRGFNAVTIILISVLVLLIAGGGFGYWWFFIKPAGAPAETITEPTPPPPPVPESIPIIPTPPPQPEPEPEPEPIPPPVITPPMATSTPPVIATSTPPIAEPTLPQAIINVDETIIIEVPGMWTTEKISRESTSAEIVKQIKEKNAKITSYKAVIRYPIKLALAKEKKYASAQETADLMDLKVPADFWKNINELELIGYKNGSVFRYGLATRTSNKEALKQVAEKWQPTMLDDLKSLYIEKLYVKPAAITFSENSYLDFYKRYINMPMPDVSLDYAISDKYFIVATSKEMIYAALDKTQTALAK